MILLTIFLWLVCKDNDIPEESDEEETDQSADQSEFVRKQREEDNSH